MSGRALQEAARAFDDDRVQRAIDIFVAALRENRPLLICGNGGSAADAQHITGELVGRFLKERRALNAICLSANTSVLTAWANDYSYDDAFARQVEAHGQKGGALLAISTSGNSANVLKAAEAARKLGLGVVSMTGRGGGKLVTLSDVILDVPSSTTPIIQQAHICLYHYICEKVEAALA
ncbi:MAG: SIS domain-containing protein [Pseudomonadota bacterium]|nr:SIS domain-containing protein [Pseudomonadota bacterium]